MVRDKAIISDGYNGQPAGIDDPCECEDKTDWKVLHAEANAILKCAQNGISSRGATLYVTLSPCRDCAKLILQAGIHRVVYRDEYRDRSGIRFLRNHGIQVDRYEP